MKVYQFLSNPNYNYPKIWKLHSLLGDVIMKTYLYNSDPLKPHFYIVKLGFTWVYIIFRISAQKQIVGTR